MKTLTLTFFVLISAPVCVLAQCMMIPISLDQHVSQSDIIVEGEIIEKVSFETAARDYIYTNYRLRITKIFKGNIQGDIIEIVEPGGIVGSRSLQVEPGVTLEKEQSFTCFLSEFVFRDPADQLRFNSPVYRGYGSSQSVFRYDLNDDQVNGVFKNYTLQEWYASLQKKTGKPIELHPLTKPVVTEQRMMPAITNISPTTLNAGTMSTLTITGTGFGATMGTSTVQFKDVNDGGMSWYTTEAAHVVSWSDVSIQVWVPTRAGTGTVRVVVGGNTATSAQTLTVPYSVLTVVAILSGSNPSVIKEVHQNDNAAGGYTFRYHTDFNANTAARQSFERALNTLRCGTEVNFTIGATTTTDVIALDNINVVRFDNGAELAANVLAQVNRVHDSCALLSPATIHIIELDVTFDDATTWEFGPALPSAGEHDFESIALHELGHANLLGHAMSASQVMYYGSTSGQSNRVLHANDLAGGIYVQGASTGTGAFCDRTPPTDYRQVKYVDQATTGIQSGDSWAHAYKKLQDALGAVTSCVDTIYVAAGSYYPDEGVGYTNNNEDHRFLLNTTIVLMGGYNATTGVRNLATNFTILSGDIDQDNVTDAQNSRNVVRITANAHLDGFWIERGNADAASGEGKDGGGIYNSASPVIRNCIFRFNRAPGSGSNGRGGAFYQASGNPVLTNILVFGSDASLSGNAFHLQSSVLTCINCTIANNDGQAPSAVHIVDGFHLLRNSVFALNYSDLTIVNPPGSAEVAHSMFEDATLAPGAFGASILTGVGPLFNSDLSLQPCSPGIHSGNGTYNTTATDVIGNTRFVGVIDRGGYEHPTGLPPLQVTTTADNVPGSLRTIIANACSGNTITFAPALTGQTIVLAGPGLTLNKNLTIHGLGMNQLSISGDEFLRIFNVNAGVTATIRDLALVNGNSQELFGNCIRNFGNLTLQNMRMSSFSGAEHPYALFNDDGTVTFKNQVIIE